MMSPPNTKYMTSYLQVAILLDLHRGVNPAGADPQPALQPCRPQHVREAAVVREQRVALAVDSACLAAQQGGKSGG